MINDIGVYSNNNSTKIRLNGNESPVEINENKLTSVVEALKNIELNRYPDTDCDGLREAYSKYAEVKKENVIAGNGSDEMLNLVISKIISKGDKILTLSTDFGMYDFYTSINEGGIVKYELDLDKEEELLYHYYVIRHLTQSEIAKLLKVSQSTVSRNISKLKKRLKDCNL